MELVKYQTLITCLETDQIPAGVSNDSNWRRYARKFKVKTTSKGKVLYRVKETEEGKVERIVLKVTDLDRVWDEVHNFSHVGRTKT